MNKTKNPAPPRLVRLRGQRRATDNRRLLVEFFAHELAHLRMPTAMSDEVREERHAMTIQTIAGDAFDYAATMLKKRKAR
jgi:hypothetical protein